MTDIATALAGRPELGSFDGKDVLRTTIAVTNAGDGLSEALKVDPQLMHLGERVYVVLECEVAKVQFVPIKDTDALSRVHVLRAGNATTVDSDLVQTQLAEQAERILLAKEAAAGVQRIPYGDELQEAHDKGEHADGLVPNCPDCDAEVAAGEAEAKAVADGEAPMDEAPAEPTPIAGRKRRGAAPEGS